MPGNPAVAERTVTMLREAERRGAVTLEIVPGISFADLAWSRLGVDPMDGARLVDGQAFAVDAAGLHGPLLIGHCINQMVLSDIKLVLLEALPPDASVTVLQRLGLPGETVSTLALEDLDRDVEADHLTSIFVDAGQAAVAGELAALVALSERLRAPGGCPWDAEQTHHSLARYLLEESYETVEAIERLPSDAPAGPVDPGAYAQLEDELGDLLYQVVFHSVLAREAGAFTIADVARGIHEKLVRRHPHIFGDVEADTVSEVMTNWEQIKKREKGSDSIVEGISPGLASLLYAHKLYRKAASVGLEPGTDAEAIGRAEAAARHPSGRGRRRDRGGARRPARGRGGARPVPWGGRRDVVARLGCPLPGPLRAHGGPRRPAGRRHRRRADRSGGRAVDRGRTVTPTEYTIQGRGASRSRSRCATHGRSGSRGPR